MNNLKMIRSLSIFIACLSCLIGGVGSVSAQANNKNSVLVEKFGSWGALQVKGSKVCYALSVPTERKPDHLKRDPGMVFISQKPKESIWEEIAIIVGFPVKKGSEITVQVGAVNFSMQTDGTHIWARTADEQKKLIDAMKRGSDMSVTATSLRGNKSTDTYSLQGISKALDKVHQICK